MESVLVSPQYQGGEVKEDKQSVLYQERVSKRLGGVGKGILP